MTDTFEAWLKRFINEKGFDMEDTIIEFVNDNAIYNYMPLGVVYEFLINQSEADKNKIRNVIIKIDFYNGDLMHFFKYIANYISNQIII